MNARQVQLDVGFSEHLVVSPEPIKLGRVEGDVAVAEDRIEEGEAGFHEKVPHFSRVAS